MAHTNTSLYQIKEMIDFLDDVKGLDFVDKEVLEGIGEQLKIQTRKRAEKEVDPAGNSWTPLNEKYAKCKAKKARHNKIMQFSGHLIDTLHHEVTDYGLKFGSNKVYAATQHHGDENRNIPARALLGISDDDKKAIAEELKNAWLIWLLENR